MKILDNIKLMEFVSKYDDSSRELLLSLPINFVKNKKHPLIISPHPFGFSNLENYTYGTPDLLEPFTGWKGIPTKYDLVLAIPLGHGRVYDKISLSWEAQLYDLSNISEVLQNDGYNITKVYVGGLSMGGMESLTVLGKYPNVFTAGFSFNGIADLAAWCNDIINGKTDKKMFDMEVNKILIEEVGGTPTQCLEEYSRRSAINYIDNLTKTPLMIYWSSRESIVVNQESKQTKKLHDLIKDRNPNSQVYEYDYSYDHGFTEFNAEERIRCHEFCDFDKATDWLLNFS